LLEPWLRPPYSGKPPLVYIFRDFAVALMLIARRRLAYTAFLEVLSPKQTRFAETISWLRAELQKVE
jgi:hypothetical protein